MFEVSAGMSNTCIARTVEEVGDKIFLTADNLLLAQRIMEMCRLMRKGDAFSQPLNGIIIKKIEQD